MPQLRHSGACALNEGIAAKKISAFFSGGFALPEVHCLVAVVVPLVQKELADLAFLAREALGGQGRAQVSWCLREKPQLLDLRPLDPLLAESSL